MEREFRPGKISNFLKIEIKGNQFLCVCVSVCVCVCSAPKGQCVQCEMGKDGVPIIPGNSLDSS